MIRRLGLWACLGFLVAAGWALYAYFTHPPALTFMDPLLILANITCPIGFVGTYFHVGVSLYWALIANAATYALIGLAVEIVRQQTPRLFGRLHRSQVSH